MPRLHLANIFFEQELEHPKAKTLQTLLSSHPISLQLQFLPLLYRKKGEYVLVSELPSQEYLSHLEQHGYSGDHLVLLNNPPDLPFRLELWGASLEAATWAKEHSTLLTQPDWERVREIHSKLFGFAETPQIPGSRLLATKEEALSWIDQTPGPKVLKKAFGVSGNGHLLLDRELTTSAQKLLNSNVPLLGEPWVKRVFDFSTQWIIGPDVEYLGATVLETNDKGVYQKTLAGPEEILFCGHEGALFEHQKLCLPLLHKIKALGFLGNLGIDAFVYEWNGKRRLRALCEINARKTFGWITLELQRTRYPGKILTLHYEKTNKTGLLPPTLGSIHFERNLLLIAR